METTTETPPVEILEDHSLKRAPGKSIYYGLIRKSDPLDLSTVSPSDLLAAVLENREAARTLVRLTGGDLTRLAERDVEGLVFEPGMGPATVGKLAAFLELSRRLLD